MSTPIPYLAGNEKPTAARMNALYGALDAKMNAILGGRSFLLAFPPSTISGVSGPSLSPDVFGKPFFFTGGSPVRYAHCAPRVNIRSGGYHFDQWSLLATYTPPVVRDYDHAPFTAAVAAATTLQKADTNHIITCAKFGAQFYTNGLPQSNWVGLLEHSLECHTMTALDAGGNTKLYFVQESMDTTMNPVDARAPEKYYRYALAEIILENLTSVTLPATYNKYQCFRLHNLNSVAATVTFTAADGADGMVVNLGPFECQSVRRDVVAGIPQNYRLSSMRYFQTFEAGDPRLHWAFATKHVQEPLYGSMINLIGWDNVQGDSVINAHVGNNLFNATVLYDWIKAFRIDDWCHLSQYTGLPDNTPLAGLHLDETVLCDDNTSPGNYGDPSNPSTPIGDLIHCRGAIRITRIKKTDDSQTFDEVMFRGYGSIVADFAAHQLGVAENSAGDLVISNLDTAHAVELTPVGTNMFAQPWLASGVTQPYELNPSVVRLHQGKFSYPSYSPASYTLTNAILEYWSTQSDVMVGHAPPFFPYDHVSPIQRITQRSVTSVVNQKTSGQTVVTGDPVQTLAYAPQPGNYVPMHAIHRVLVSDILNLKYFGTVAAGTNQSDQYVQFTDAALRLTTQGPVLTFTEKVVTSPLPALAFPYYTSPDWPGVNAQKWHLDGALDSGRFQIKHAIKFRGHGYGYGEDGHYGCGFFPAGHARYATVHGITNDVSGPDGADFSVSGCQFTVTSITCPRQINTGEYTAPSGAGYQRLQNAPFNGRFWTINAAQQDGLGSGTVALPLCAVHYNNMTRFVNACTLGTPLTYTCLRWVVNGQYVTFPAPAGLDNGLPVPADCFLAWRDSSYDAIFANVGIPIRGVADFPSEFAALRTAFNQSSQVALHLNGSLANVRAVSDPPVTPNFSLVLGDVTFSVSASLLPGTINTAGMDAGCALFATAALAADGTVTGGPAGPPVYGGGPLELSTYDAIKWVRISDVNTALQALGFPLSYQEVCEPMTMEMLDAGSQLVVRSDLTIANGYVEAMALGANVGVENYTALGGASQDQVVTRQRQFIGFRYARTAAEARWKRPAPEFNGNANGVASVFTVKDYTAHPGLDFYTYQSSVGFSYYWRPGYPLACGWGASFSNLPTQGTVNDGPPHYGGFAHVFSQGGVVQSGDGTWNCVQLNFTYLNGTGFATNSSFSSPNQGTLYLEFAGANPAESAQRDVWVEWMQGHRRTLAVICLAATPQVRFFLSPAGYWTHTKDWFSGNRTQWNAALGDPNAAPWEFNSATYAPLIVAAATGTTIIQAPDNTAYRVLIEGDATIAL